MILLSREGAKTQGNKPGWPGWPTVQQLYVLLIERNRVFLLKN